MLLPTDGTAALAPRRRSVTPSLRAAPGAGHVLLVYFLPLPALRAPRGLAAAAPGRGRPRGQRRLTMALPARKCGRPSVLSFLEKKRRKQSLDRRRGKTRIYVGNHIDRWLTLKEKLDFRSDAEVAGFLLDLYDNYDLLTKAPECSLPGGVRRITVKEERGLSDSACLIAADGKYADGDQLSKEAACPEYGGFRVVTVKEEQEMPPHGSSAETDDTATSKKEMKHLNNDFWAAPDPFWFCYEGFVNCKELL